MSNIETGPSMGLPRTYELAIDELLEAADELRPLFEKLKACEPWKRGLSGCCDRRCDSGIPGTG